MRRHHKQPQSHQNDRHDARDPLNPRAEQLLADLDERDREPDVGEDHGVPDAFETHLPGGLQGGDEGDAEEPEGEGPDEAVWKISRVLVGFGGIVDLHREEESELLHHLCHSWVLGKDAIVRRHAC